MQALYFCVPFREQLLEYYGNNRSIGDAEENLLTCLADLFSQVISLSFGNFSCYMLDASKLYHLWIYDWLKHECMIDHLRVCFVFTNFGYSACFGLLSKKLLISQIYIILLSFVCMKQVQSHLQTPGFPHGCGVVIILLKISNITKERKETYFAS